ncbi:MAG: ABC transporter permease [Chitinophagaceae bacterium]|nr:ABC transporter permease [Chitinophagaceae bacterium]
MNFVFAWRYFKSKKTTNAINIIAWVSVTAIAVVTAAIIIVLSVFNGFEGLVKSLYSDFYADIKISSTQHSFQFKPEQFIQLKEINGVDYFSGIVEEKAILLNEGLQSIVVLKAVDTNYTSVNKIQQYVHRGEFKLGHQQEPQIVLGAGIENALGVDVEHHYTPLLLYMPNRNSNKSITSLEGFNSATINPVGTFLVQQEFDNKYVFTNLSFAQYMLDFKENEYTSIEILLSKNANPESVKKSLQQLLGAAFKVETRYEQNSSLFKIMQVEKWFIYALLSLILAIAAFNIVGALTMLVLEKQKDIHILKAMGANEGLIRKIFLTEGIMLASIGGGIGILISIIICLLQQHFHFIKLEGGTFIIDYYPVKMLLFDFILTIFTILFIAFVASWIPSAKAAKSLMQLKS